MLRHARSVFFLAAVLFLAVLAFVWLKPAQQGVTAVSPPVASPADAAPLTAAAPPSSSSLSANSAATPAQSATFAERRAVLEQRAAGGDSAAAAELGAILALCWRYTAATQENLEEAVVNGIAAGVEPPEIAGTPASPELILLFLQHSQQELARRCETVGAVPRSREELATAPGLLERAADAGEVQAMLDYAEHAFVNYHGAAELLPDADEVKRRKDKARAFLDQALRRGDARALLLKADAYARGQILQLDVFASYVHMSAFFESSAAQDWSPRLRELYLQALAQGLDAARVAQAREQGQQLYRDFMAGVSPQ